MDENELFKEEDNIFNEDDALDCIMFQEAEKEEIKGSKAGCLTTILMAISIFFGIAFLVLWIKII
jgi:hypothetical protein